MVHPADIAPASQPPTLPDTEPVKPIGDDAAVPWVLRHAVLLIGVVPIGPQLIGSIFNIWYNIRVLEPTLTPLQLGRFNLTVIAFNLTVYPLAIALWVLAVSEVHLTQRQLLTGGQVDADRLQRARRRSINLPWWLGGIAGFAWLACIPTFLAALAAGDEQVSRMAGIHLPVSFVIGGSIAITQGFFLVELLTQRLVFPVLFGDANPSETDGALSLGLRGHFMLWAIAAGICPIVSLVLLNLADIHNEPGLSVFVGVVGVCFCLLTAALASMLIESPVRALRVAAQRVSDGDLHVEIRMRRADEFGTLIEDVNDMVTGLREKERIEETFGRHIGQQAAQRVLRRNPNAVALAEQVTVMFVDVRGFTTRSSTASPEEIVRLLNRLFTRLVEVVEAHEGMVNKFLGDGMMALFDTASDRRDHADQCVQAALAMQAAVVPLNRELREEGVEPLEIGIGIHSGEAVVGSIGSPRRQEYTAIGDTVNCAARIQDLTKHYEATLISAATRARLRHPENFGFADYPDCQIRGRAEPLSLYGVRPAKSARGGDACDSDD
ncbi:MAG: adenylate/guanylate cyclase domain-containing protein [Planctomycetales bacterium]|nr:adenylate/guanylate cyclase domain-containing protein [Planctomycetales bacterium]